MTIKDAPSLSHPQWVALAALVRGCSITDAAAEAKVERQTVSRWANHDAQFQAQLNRQRVEVWNETQDQLRSVTRKALMVIESLLDEPQTAQEVAIDVMKMLPRLNLVPTGPTNAKEIAYVEMLESAIYD